MQHAGVSGMWGGGWTRVGVRPVQQMRRVYLRCVCTGALAGRRTTAGKKIEGQEAETYGG